jgi:hypothetical protein
MNVVNPSGAVLSESSVREEYRRRINEGSSASKHLRFIVEPEKAPQQSYLAWAKHT